MILACSIVSMSAEASEAEQKLVSHDMEKVKTSSPYEHEQGGRWILDKTGWWYQRENGTWPSGTIVNINGTLYGFDASGYMVSGWYLSSQGWYYFEESGAMYEGWLLDKGIWYYLDKDNEEYPGVMLSDTSKKINGAVYEFYPSGAMAVGWKSNPEGWYYFDVSGAMCTGWIKLNGIWYYLDETNTEYPGLMLEAEWEFIKDEWYYFYTDGAMATNWLLRSEGWYYMGMDGAMKTGWQLVNNKWYYFYRENDEYGGQYGVMAVNTTIDDWDILESGIAINGLQKKIEEIKAYEGYPYVYGGNTPEGWDCSGFTQWTLNYFGVSIGRTAEAQFNGGSEVDMNDMSCWKPGDILVYISTSGEYSHTALYLGDGMLMHALNPNRGTVIQEVEYYEKVDRSNTLAGVRRYL